MMTKKKMIKDFIESCDIKLGTVYIKEFYKKDKRFVEEIIKNYKEVGRKIDEIRTAFKIQNGEYTIPVDLKWEGEEK